MQGVDHRAAGVACVPARLCVCVFDRGVTSQPTFHPLCVVVSTLGKKLVWPPLLLEKQPAGVKGEAKKHKERDT